MIAEWNFMHGRRRDNVRQVKHIWPSKHDCCRDLMQWCFLISWCQNKSMKARRTKGSTLRLVFQYSPVT